MAGVDLREENAQILTTMVGSVVQSCQDQLFLLPKPVLSRILHTGTRAVVIEIEPRGCWLDSSFKDGDSNQRVGYREFNHDKL